MAAFTTRIVLPAPQQMARAVLSQIRDILDRAIGRSLKQIAAVARPLVERSLRRSPEYASLLNDDLWHQMGVLHPQAALNTIVAVIKDDITAFNDGVRLTGGGVTATVKLQLLANDYASILNNVGGSFTTTNGYRVDWLKWLLTSGDSIVITDHYYIPKEGHWSRTGKGLMVKSQKGWQVPSEFAGTAADNWITRSIGKVVDEVGQAGLDIIIRNLQ